MTLHLCVVYATYRSIRFAQLVGSGPTPIMRAGRSLPEGLRAGLPRAVTYVRTFTSAKSDNPGTRLAGGVDERLRRRADRHTEHATQRVRHTVSFL